MALKVNGTKRLVSSKTVCKRDVCTASYGRWTETAVATLNVIVQILVFMLSKWAGLLRNEINGFSDNLVLTFKKSTEKLMNTTRVVRRNLGVEVGKLFNTTNEPFDADLIAATSDVIGDLMTEPSNEENIVKASKATVAVRVEATDQSSAPADNVCGEQQEKNRLPLKNNLVEQNSNVRPKMSQGKSKFKSILIKKRTTTKCEENPEKCVEIISNTQQPSVLKIEGLVYEDLTPNVGPVASCRVDKMAEWRRKKFFADDEATVTPETAKVLDRATAGRDEVSADHYRTTAARHILPVTPETAKVLDRATEGRDTSPENRDRTTEGRDEVSADHYSTTAARHILSRGPATRSQAQNDITCTRPVPDSDVPLTAVPPPQGPGHFWHEHPEPFVSPSLPGPRHSSHGPLGPFTGPPPPGSRHLSHGPAGPMVGPPPPGPAHFWHGHHGPIAGLPLPTSGHYRNTHPEPIAGLPLPTSGHYRNTHPEPFAQPPPLAPRHFRYRRPRPFAGPSLPTSGHFRNTHPEPFAQPHHPTSGHFRNTHPEPFAQTPPPTSGHFQYRRPEPFGGPPLQTSGHFQYRRPGPFAGPPIRSGSTANAAVLHGIWSAMMNAHSPGQGPCGPLSTFASDA